jgi:hypothetical protein
VNARIVRGRTTTGDGYVYASQPLDRGSFSLDVPYQRDDWYLLVETPRRIVALEGPIAIGAGEKKSVELKTRASGGLRGVVSNHSAVNLPLYAVLFSNLGIQYETRVRSDGSFAFADVFPGEYGLKVGCHSILDSEVPDTSAEGLSVEQMQEIYSVPSEPWSRAVRVKVEEGTIVEGITVGFEP